MSRSAAIHPSIMSVNQLCSIGLMPSVVGSDTTRRTEGDTDLLCALRKASVKTLRFAELQHS